MKVKKQKIYKIQLDENDYETLFGILKFAESKFTKLNISYTEVKEFIKILEESK